MDKTRLLTLIQNAEISQDVKKELESTVAASSSVTPELVSDLTQKLHNHADSLVENIANLQIEDAAETASEELGKLEKDIDAFNADISKQADEIDLQQARSKLS